MTMRVLNLECQYSTKYADQDKFFDRVFVSCSESESTGSWGIVILVVRDGVTMAYSEDEQGKVDLDGQYVNRGEREWFIRLLRGMDNICERLEKCMYEDKISLMAHLMALFSEDDFCEHKWEVQES